MAVGELAVGDLPIVVVRIIVDLKLVTPLGHKQRVRVEPRDVPFVAGLRFVGRIPNPSGILRRRDKGVVEARRIREEAVLVPPSPRRDHAVNRRVHHAERPGRLRTQSVSPSEDRHVIELDVDPHSQFDAICPGPANHQILKADVLRHVHEQRHRLERGDHEGKFSRVSLAAIVREAGRLQVGVCEADMDMPGVAVVP